MALPRGRWIVDEETGTLIELPREPVDGEPSFDAQVAQERAEWAERREQEQRDRFPGNRP